MCGASSATNVSPVNQTDHKTTVTRALPIKVQQLQPKILINATILTKPIT